MFQIDIDTMMDYYVSYYCKYLCAQEFCFFIYIDEIMATIFGQLE